VPALSDLHAQLFARNLNLTPVTDIAYKHPFARREFDLNQDMFDSDVYGFVYNTCHKSTGQVQAALNDAQRVDGVLLDCSVTLTTFRSARQGWGLHAVV